MDLHSAPWPVVGGSCMRPTVSLCMIVRNEATNLAAALKPLVGLFHEAIVVDTGSTDGTQRLAFELGAKVIDFPWVDDFSAARNASVAAATGDFIFWLDADDRFESAELSKLKDVLANLSPAPRGYMMHCVCSPEAAGDLPYRIPHLRLFPRLPELRWRYRVHEQILPSLEENGVPWDWTDVEIQHIGYQDPAVFRKKANRDLRLLRLDYLAHPDDPVVHFHTGMTHLRIGDFSAALESFLQSLKRIPENLDWVRKLYSFVYQCLRKLGRPEEALAMSAEGLSRFPDDPDLLAHRAEGLSFRGDLIGTEQCLMRLIRLEADQRATISPGLPLLRRDARRMLGLLYLDTYRHEQAERMFQELLAENPDYLHGWVSLGFLYLQRNEFQNVDYVSRQLEKCSGGQLFADILRAQSLTRQGRFQESKPLLDQAIAHAPAMIWPRIVLGEWYARSGADRETCVAAQRDILRLDPSNPEAQASLRRLEAPAEYASQSATFVVSR